MFLATHSSPVVHVCYRVLAPYVPPRILILKVAIPPADPLQFAGLPFVVESRAYYRMVDRLIICQGAKSPTRTRGVGAWAEGGVDQAPFKEAHFELALG